jgi:hypothetical protein
MNENEESKVDSVKSKIIGPNPLVLSIEGLDRRSLFAAIAMQGMCVRMVEFGRTHADIIAVQAVEIADVLLKELKK